MAEGTTSAEMRWAAPRRAADSSATRRPGRTIVNGAGAARCMQGDPAFLAGGGELAALVRAKDWAATLIGPPETWPRSLKTAVRIMLTSRQPIWIGWGEELTYLYNDAYKAIIGGKHPWALGRPATEVWREISGG